MTTTFQPPGPTGARFRLPDIPEREPDDMTSFRSLHRIGISASLAQCLGHPDTTIVGAELYIVPGPAYVAGESRYPDLLVAFDVDPEAYDASNGYIVSEQGKPPDFVLEVASRRTARLDRTVKKDYYESLGVGEYWLFDRTGEFYGFRLAGFRLEQGRYQPIPLQESPTEVQGHSEALNLDLRWNTGDLEWLDPSGVHIPTLASETARADAARRQAEDANIRADAERRHADAARRQAEDANIRAGAARRQAEDANIRADAAAARVQELEAELNRLRNT